MIFTIKEVTDCSVSEVTYSISKALKRFITLHLYWGQSNLV